MALPHLASSQYAAGSNVSASQLGGRHLPGARESSPCAPHGRCRTHRPALGRVVPGRLRRHHAYHRLIRALICLNGWLTGSPQTRTVDAEMAPNRRVSPIGSLFPTVISPPSDRAGAVRRRTCLVALGMYRPLRHLHGRRRPKPLISRRIGWMLTRAAEAVLPTPTRDFLGFMRDWLHEPFDAAAVLRRVHPSLGGR